MDVMRRGFTLVELLVFIAVFSAVVIGFVTIFIAATRVQSRQTSASEVETQAQFLLQQVQYYVGAARLVDMAQDVATGTLKLRQSSSATSSDPITIYASSGIVYLQQGAGGAAQALSSNRVTVANLSFTRHYNLTSSSTAYGTDSVSFSFTVSASNAGVGSSRYYSQSFQSSVAVLVPVPKIALVQQATGVNNAAGVSSVTASYGSNNATGSLLIAVVSNVGTSTATTSISDTAGNAWALIASTSFPAYGQKTVIYDALNAQSGANTVSTTFGTAVNYPSLFLYEYRGASTASSFDASSTLNQSGVASPSSGSANPTSSVELLFGVMYSNPSTEVPAAGNGFTLETTSSVSATYAEDTNFFITGPVSAGFLYSQTPPSSSVTLVTFK